MTDKIATDLLRLALDPGSGRIRSRRRRRRSRLDVALRAALLCDLALAGALTAEAGAPRTTDASTAASGVAEDHILATLSAAIARRPGVVWHRWLRNVAADRAALAAELVAQGTWTRRGGVGTRYTDHGRDLERLQNRIVAVQRFAQPPGSPREGVLGYLVELCEPLTGPDRDQRWQSVLATALEEVDSEDARAAVHACLRAAATAGKRRSLVGSAALRRNRTPSARSRTT